MFMTYLPLLLLFLFFGLLVSFSANLTVVVSVFRSVCLPASQLTGLLCEAYAKPVAWLSSTISHEYFGIHLDIFSVRPYAWMTARKIYTFLALPNCCLWPGAKMGHGDYEGRAVTGDLCDNLRLLMDSSLFLGATTTTRRRRR